MWHVSKVVPLDLRLGRLLWDQEAHVPPVPPLPHSRSERCPPGALVIGLHAGNLRALHGPHLVRSLRSQSCPPQTGPSSAPRRDLEPEEEECRDSEQPKPSYTSPSTTLLNVAFFAQDDFLAILLQLADAHDKPNHIRNVELDVNILPVLPDES